MKLSYKKLWVMLEVAIGIPPLSENCLTIVSIWNEHFIVNINAANFFCKNLYLQAGNSGGGRILRLTTHTTKVLVAKNHLPQRSKCHETKKPPTG